MKITNVINPYTMKSTPLQPSLINPIFMMAKGIGYNKKAISLSEAQVQGLIAKQNNLTISETPIMSEGRNKA
jgi:hypothetical protein